MASAEPEVIVHQLTALSGPMSIREARHPDRSSAFAMTALVFGGLSAYVLITRKDMSFLGGFITAGFFVLLAAVVASMFFQISGLQLAISAGFVLFSSVCILFQTSAIIHGGERNYIMATVSLYVSLYNIFVSLLSILGLSSRN